MHFENLTSGVIMSLTGPAGSSRK